MFKYNIGLTSNIKLKHKLTNFTIYPRYLLYLVKNSKKEIKNEIIVIIPMLYLNLKKYNS